MEAEVSWSEGDEPITCDSLAAVDRLLDGVHATSLAARPALAVVVYHGYGICIGLGIDPTVIEIHYPPCDGESYTSASDSAGEGLVDFYGRGGHFQYERRTFVPLAEARRAVRQFIETGQRSDRIRWLDWNGRPAEPDAAEDGEVSQWF